MKIRLGFVSNSSSASFTIPLSKLSTKQIYQLMNYWKLGEDSFYYEPLINAQILSRDKKVITDFCCGTVDIPYNMWKVEKDGEFIIGKTGGDGSYDMKGYMESIGISLDDVDYIKTF